MCSDDPFDNGVSNLVVNRPVVSAADEELVLQGEKVTDDQTQNSVHVSKKKTQTLHIYLNVDVVFALDDDLDVGVMNGLLMVLYACRPVSRRPQDLQDMES